jgi:hypothetical protein
VAVVGPLIHSGFIAAIPPKTVEFFSRQFACLVRLHRVSAYPALSENPPSTTIC